MVLDWNKNLLFIHIPRTAGTTIEYLMNIPLNSKNLYGWGSDHKAKQHFTAEKICTIIGETYFDKCFKFTIVRNPYDRMISEYYWDFRMSSNDPHFIERGKLGYKSGQTFKQFLESISIIVKEKKYDENLFFDHFRPQYEFVSINDKICVNEVGKFENISEYVKSLIKNHDFDENKLRHHNKGNYNKNINHYDDPVCIKIINELYAKDFELFDYTLLNI